MRATGVSSTLQLTTFHHHLADVGAAHRQLTLAIIDRGCARNERAPETYELGASHLTAGRNLGTTEFHCALLLRGDGAAPPT